MLSLTLLALQATRVLAVGDSWAFGAEAPLETALFNHGAPADVVSIGVPGSHASVWASAGGCSSILSWLGSLPMVDTVHVEVGINDLLAAWNSSMTQAQTDALAAAIALDVQAIVDCAQTHAPGLEVVSRCYDFPNFAAYATGQCGTLWAAMGSPTPAQVNTALLSLDAALAQRALWDPRWTHVGMQGSTQVLGGGSIDPTQPSPASFMIDCLHLRGAAAIAFSDAAWAPFYFNQVGTGMSPSFSGLVPGLAGQVNSLSMVDGDPAGQVVFVGSLGYTPTPAPSCPGMVVLSPSPFLIGAATADFFGTATMQISIPPELAGLIVWSQALMLDPWCIGSQPARSIL